MFINNNKIISSCFFFFFVEVFFCMSYIVKVIGNKIMFYGDVNNKSCFDIYDKDTYNAADFDACTSLFVMCVCVIAGLVTFTVSIYYNNVFCCSDILGDFGKLSMHHYCWESLESQKLEILQRVSHVSLY